MAIPKPKHLKRYQQIAWLLVKHGRSDLAHAAGLDEVAADSPVGREMAAEAESLADDLEALGPTFVKLGQLLSTRPDLLPPAYLKALARLHDKVVSFGFADVEKIVTSELGVRLSELLPGVLAEDAVIVTESDKRKPLDLAMPQADERTYGDTRIAIHRG